MQPASIRVLLIGRDQGSHCLALGESLTGDQGTIDVEWVSPGSDPVKRVTRGEIDVLLVDYPSGVQDSQELVRALSRLQKHVPAILLADRPCRQSDLAALDIGAVDCLPKAELDPDLFARTIRHAHERSKNLELLRAAEHRYRTLVEQIPAAIYTLPNSGGTSEAYVSPQIERITGYPADNWRRDPKFGLTIIHPDDSKRLTSAFERAGSTGDPLRVEYRYRCADGRLKWVRNEAVLVAGPSSEQTFWQGFVFDITEQKRAEEALLARERQQTAVAMLAQEALVAADIDTLLNLAVAVVTETLGLEFSALLELSPDGQELELRAGIGWQPGVIGRARVDTGFASHAGYTLYRGEPVVVEDLRTETRFSASQLLHDHGVVSALGVIIPVTQRPYGVLGAYSCEERAFSDDEARFLQSIAAVLGTHVHRAQQEDELRFQAHLLDVVEEAVIATDLNGRITYWNRFAEQLYGWQADEVLGRNIAETVPSEMSAEHASERASCLAAGESWSGEFQLKRRDDTTFWGQVTDSPVYDACGDLIGVIGVSHDITERRQGAEALREAEERYRMLVEQIPAMVFIADPKDVGHVLYHNPQVSGILGYTKEEWTADPRFWMSRIHPDDLDLVSVSDERANATHAPFSIEYRMIAKDGRVVWIRESAQMIRDDDGTPRYWQGVSYDVTESRKTEEAARQLAAIVTSSSDAIYGWGLDGTITSWNSGAERMYGYTAGEVVGQNVDLLTPVELYGELEALGQRILQGEAVQNFETRRLCRDGSWIDVSLTISPLLDCNGAVVGGSTISRDITDRKELERQLVHQAFHDSLTRLPNRALFLDRLSHALRRSERRNDRVGVLFVDLDNFKVVNDSLGHSHGDRLLIEVAERLKQGLRASDTLARMGGDEFTILLDDLADVEAAVAVAQRIVDLLQEPFAISSGDVHVTASIGVAVSTAASNQAEDLVRGADTAMYHAKSQGKGHHAVFDPEMHRQALNRLEVEQQLRRAIDSGELLLHYQPKWHLETREIVGVEALVRWNHPTRGLIYPAEFISVAEETGLILPLGEWVLWEAGRQASIWLDRYDLHPEFVMSVNLSGRQFQLPSLERLVASMLAETGLAPSYLMLEITETDVMADTETTIRTLQALKNVGVRLAIDDFGTGYSSLSRLRRFPVDYLKIDRSFVGGLQSQQEDTVLVASLVRLAHEMGMRVIAEGVEVQEQVGFLRELNCDIAQGYFLCRPLPAAALESIICAAAEKTEAFVGAAQRD